MKSLNVVSGKKMAQEKLHLIIWREKSIFRNVNIFINICTTTYVA